MSQWATLPGPLIPGAAERGWRVGGPAPSDDDGLRPPFGTGYLLANEQTGGLP
eukprot:CAMPEP_0179907312 /NCGR_PEP_ID=MMETSP0982-20121206/43811_1 /TAXON_ID=483367 /ORGANISM="non described non described, Strain CCMP 2436" /LENGTH=52 /DNA_ID=CAMNT_0021808079 /DNA_START=30 /DNA_END=185 /DNA_ORIENTATION=-